MCKHFQLKNQTFAIITYKINLYCSIAERSSFKLLLKQEWTNSFKFVSQKTKIINWTKIVLLSKMYSSNCLR